MKLHYTYQFRSIVEINLKDINFCYIKKKIDRIIKQENIRSHYDTLFTYT